MNLQPYLERMGVDYQLAHHPQTFTAQQLAQAEHISGHHVIKPVLVEADGQMVLCAIPASRRLDVSSLRRELGAEDLVILDEDRLKEVFEDCELGAEPPIGAMFGLPTIMDDSLFQAGEVTFQAGSHDESVTMSLADYRKLAQPGVGHFSVIVN